MLNRLLYTIKVVLLACILLLVGCRKENPAPIKINSSSDEYGNLYIINKSGEPLLLYAHDTLLKEIPADSNKFLVFVEPGEFAITLKIWKKSIVLFTNEPDPGTLFRQWVVVLSQSNIESERSTWVIQEEGGQATGTLRFFYPDHFGNNISSLYSVDVYLDNKTGAKITSIGPGTSNKKVGVRYGYHLLYYRYWYDDPDDELGAQEVGWIETDSLNHGISVVINASNDFIDIDIPVYYYSNIGRKGRLFITNNINEDIVIWVNNTQYLENYAYVPGGDPTGLSYIKTDKTSEFFVDQRAYNLSAKTTNNEVVEIYNNFKVIEIYDSYWAVSQDITYKNLEIINNSENRYSIHDRFENYIGFWIDKNSTETFKIRSELDTLMAISWDKMRIIISDSLSNQWVIN
ncbi:MAG: hypothetical protein K8R53_07380 [Bacteroidales bacterium]|nr:hypothetical protein [Bacteroidales bacterium]